MGRAAWITGALTVMGTVSWAAEWIPKIAPDERAVRSGLYIAPRQPAKNARVEFTVTEPSGIARRSWPVRGGLPIFRGELADPKAIRLLDGEGREVPVHGKITAFWPEKTAKFLCVDFLTDIGAGETRKFALEYGTEVRPSAAGRVAVSEKGGGEIEVSTGAAVFVFRTGADFLSVALKDPAATFRATGRATVCRDEKGSDPKVLQLTIDEARVTESGPVQATVHLLGHYGPDKSGPAAQGNEETWKYPASLHFRIYGGTGHAYVEHCFGYNGDVFSEFVQSYGLAVTAGPGREFRFGPDAASEAVLPAGSRVCQYAHDRWSIPGEEEKAGKRIGGWAAIVGGGPRALAAVREAWQNWPVAFSAGRDGTLLVEMLGEMPGRALDLRYEAKDRQNEKIPSHSMFFGDKLTLYYSGPDHKMRGQAKGVRKIHELLLEFGGSGPARDAGMAHQLPLVPWPGEKRFFETRALGHIAVYGDPKYEHLRQYYSIMLDAFPLTHEANGLYGWVDWGDFPMCRGVRDGKFVLSMDGGVGWSNGERALAPYFWHYAAGGGRRFLDMGRAMVHHTLGMDTEHSGGDTARGVMHRHNQVHWRHNESGIRQSGYRGWFAYYWLSGDPEVLRLAMDAGIDAPANSCVMDIRPGTAVPNVNVDNQGCAAHFLAHWQWITTGDDRFARAHHALMELWVRCGEAGKAQRQGWDSRIRVKDGRLDGGEPGADGPLSGYWFTYGGDDLCLEWASLTGDPAAVDAILLQGKIHGSDKCPDGPTQLYCSPEALYLGLAMLQPDHPHLKRLLEKRDGMRLHLRQVREKGIRTTGAYASADDWNRNYALGDYGLGLFGSSGKNGFSINAAEALEVLMWMRAMDLLEESKRR